MKKIGISLALTGVLLLAWFAVSHFPRQPYTCATGQVWNAYAREPLYITPHYQNLELADPKKLEKLTDLLEELEPGGAQGRVRLGYQLAIELYWYLQKHGGKWVANMQALRDKLEIARKFGRPFVVYVKSNHFQRRRIEYLQEALKEPRNLMRYRDGQLYEGRYFDVNLTPFVLSNDPSIPAARDMFMALKAVAKTLHEFHEKNPGLMIGIELNGETHYLFEDFFNGTGNYDNPRFTDYSDQELKEFAEYLRQKKSSLDASRIKDIPFSRYEWGKLAISGWLEAGEEKVSIELYVDGRKAGAARPHINRLDVYGTGTPAIRNPNTGFEGSWDFTEASAGRHILQVVVVREDGKKELLGKAHIIKDQAEESIMPSGLSLPQTSLRGYLDRPSRETLVHYEPLAAEWIRFRETQVAKRISAMAEVFINAGFDEGMIYSYQLAPWLIGSWNPVLFGVGEDFFRMPGMRPGMNLYGGNIENENIFDYMNGPYGIPEFHPQMQEAEGIIERGLRFHYCQGAVFLSPYFFGGEPEHNPHDYMRIQPENATWSSDHFHHALKAFLRY